MKVFLTGATGFIGGKLAQILAGRGDEVVVLVRDTTKAAHLVAMGCALHEGDLDSDLKGAMVACDVVIHNAAIYRVGIPASKRPEMHRANVEGTKNVIGAALAAGVGRVVYVSTVNAFGNTKGEVVDESYARDVSEGFVTYYDETKYLAHKWVADRVADGAPIVIVQPGLVYGPGDNSDMGNLIDQVRTGKMKLRVFPETGYNAVFIDDVAEGIVKALDKGRLGQSYVIGGQITTGGEVMDTVARIAGRKPPSIKVPTALLKMSAPLGPVIGPVMGFPPNMKELINAADGVTYWAKDDKARAELGHTSRSLEEGLKLTLGVG